MPFTALASLVMESVAAGIGVLVCIVIGIAVLGGFFSALLWVCTRLSAAARISPGAHGLQQPAPARARRWSLP